MLFVLVILVVLFLASLVLYIRVQPKDMSPSGSRLFNYCLGTIAAVAVFAVAAYFRFAATQTGDTAWWPGLALLGSLFVLAVLFVAATAIRFVVFRSPPN